MSPTPVSGHQHVSYRLVQLVGSHVDRRRLGQVFFAPMTVRLGTHDIVQPDLLFLSTAKRALIKEGVVEGTPDLVIEILSPSTQRVDLVRKRALYERAGVTEYWIVDIQAKRIRQFHLQDGHYLETDTRGGKLTSMVVIGLTIEIAPVFADLWE